MSVNFQLYRIYISFIYRRRDTILVIDRPKVSLSLSSLWFFENLGTAASKLNCHSCLCNVEKNSGGVWYCACIQTEVKCHVTKCADKTFTQFKPYIQSRYCIALIFTMCSNIFTINNQWWKWYGQDDQGIVVLFPAMKHIFSHRVHTWSGAHQDTYSTSIVVYFHAGKRQARKTSHSSLSTNKIRTRPYASSPTYALTVCIGTTLSPHTYSRVVKLM